MQIHRYRVTAAVAFLLLPATGALAQVIDGEVRGHRMEPVRDYAAGDVHQPRVLSQTVASPGAQFVRVHFKSLHLAPGDYLTVADAGGSVKEVLQGLGPHGDGQDVWSFAVPGDAVLLTLHAGARRDAQPLGLGKPAFGYEVDALVHGTQPLEEESGEVFSSRPQTALELVGGIEPQSVCGTLGYENVACHPEIGAAQRPVARLLAVSGGSRSVRCTGWLVAGSNANTLVTNNHCFSTAAAVRSVEAQFNYQFTTCNGTTTATTTSFRGQTLLRTVGQPLDYTLLTLDGGESLFGEVIPSLRRAVVGERIWIIQHPGGQRKKIGFWRNAGHTNPCTVQAVTSSQVQYNCDTEGGSSGSVVLAPPTSTTPTARAIGLHHLGGCPNSAAQMQLICNSAGALLRCQ